MATTIVIKKTGKTKTVPDQVAKSLIRQGEATFVSKISESLQPGYLSRNIRPNKLKTK